MRARPTLLLLLATGLAACSGPERRAGTAEALPFTARVKEVRLRGPAPADAGDDEPAAPKAPVIPARFGAAPALTRAFARALEEKGIFTRVVTEADRETPADLDIEIEIAGQDFGPGEATFWGAFSSTVVWLLAGHLSWFLDNRVYPHSDVILYLTVRPAVNPVVRPAGAGRPAPAGGPAAPAGSPPAWLGGPGQGALEEAPSPARRAAPRVGSAPQAEAGGLPAALFQDALRLRSLGLSFLERADMRYWFFNILLPPWWDDGDPEKAGESLVQRTVDFFRDTEPERIGLGFPGSYYRATARYLFYDESRKALVIISREPLAAIAIRAGGRTRRIDDPDELIRLEDRPAAENEELRLALSERVLGLAGGGSGAATHDRYYVVRLEESEVGELRIAVLPRLEGLLSRWTIQRPSTPAR
jgi:hypothetical protein